YPLIDTKPQAPTHLLIVPKVHYEDILDLGHDPEASAGYLAGIRGLVEQEGLHEFRTVFNTGSSVGQSVFHVHAHVLSGRPMGWPPGCVDSRVSCGAGGGTGGMTTAA